MPKVFVVIRLSWIDGMSGLDALLEITYVTNPGAAWSMFSDYPEFLTVLAGIALISIYIFRTQALELNPIHSNLFLVPYAVG